ncbi:MAG: ABC transporter permease [Actinobacteria bacterium]|nr:ABC transporter permease [Actinomycetota bacterium]MCL5883500.1 ABC transporter permease [Actinomycetota bacterium]
MKKINSLQYYGLVRELTLTDFKLKYKASFFGYLWSLAKPLMLFGVLLVVFSKFLKLGGSIPDYPVYLLLGIVLWTFFIEATFSSLTSIVSKGDLIRKVYFPRIILTISASVTASITLLLNIVVVLIFMFFSKISLTVTAPLILALMIEFFILTAGVSLILASLFVRFRDIAHIWEVAAQVLFYATPILYPLSLVPESLGQIIMLNPLAQIIQDSRYVLITNETGTVFNTLSFPLNVVPYAMPFVVFAAGYWIFQKEASKFAEEI